MQGAEIAKRRDYRGRKDGGGGNFEMAAASDRRYSAAVSGRIFRYIYRVVYADCTVGNHIYYSRYLDILEAARGEFFRELGLPLLGLQAEDTIFPVVECHLRYKSPARYDDVLTTELWTTLVQGARLNFGFRILKDEKILILEGETFHVCTGLNEKPKRVPETLITELNNFLTTDEHG